MSKNSDYCFAALKLIEQLYKDGKIRIRDSHDNRYVIEDYRALDKHSKSLLIGDLQFFFKIKIFFDGLERALRNARTVTDCKYIIVRDNNIDKNNF